MFKQFVTATVKTFAKDFVKSNLFGLTMAAVSVGVQMFVQHQQRKMAESYKAIVAA